MNAIRQFQRTRRHPAITLPLLAAAVVIAAYFTPVLLGRGLIMGNDGLLLFYPAEQALAEALRQGTLPFWTPEIQAGFPLLADGQPGVLYPPNLLAFGLLPAPLAHNLLTIVHALLGLVFVYWWGRTLNRSRTASALMGLVFALSTPLTGSKMPVLETLAWTPLLFVLTERFVQRRTLTWAWMLAPVVGLQWLAGFPQITLYSLVAASLYLTGRLWFEEPDRRHAITLILIWSVPIVLGMGLAAPQLLPTYELAQHSIRASGIGGSMAGEKSLFPAALATLLLPSWQPFFAGAGLGFGVYVGIVPLALALVALTRRPERRWTLPLLLVSLGTIVLSFDRFSPLFPILRELPGFSSFRVPSRFLILTQLALVALAGFGWDVIFAQDRGAQPWVGRLLTAAGLLFVGNTILGYPLLAWLRPHLLQFAETFTRRYILAVGAPSASDPYHVQPWSYYQAKIERLYDALLHATVWSNPDVWLPFLVLLAAWIFWHRRHSMPASRLAGLWGVLIVVDLFAAGGVAGTIPTSWVTEPPEIVEQPLDTFTPITTIGTIQLYRNEQAFPRAFLVDRVEQAASAEEAVEWTKAHGAILRTTAPVESQKPLSLTTNAAATSRVAVQRYEPTRVDLQVSASGDVLLVLTDTFYPGWRATVDGRPARIYRAYGHFRTLVVPAGDHDVAFTYTPHTFRRGLVLAGIAGIVWLLPVAGTIRGRSE